MSRYSVWKNKREQKKKHPECCVCGRLPRWFQIPNQVHRILPEHLFEHLADDLNNMATMCRFCHFVFGHLRNWKKYNKNFWETVKAVRLVLRDIAEEGS